VCNVARRAGLYPSGLQVIHNVSRNSKPPDFEQALAELESLVERLERGDVPLDEALRTFERGVALTRHCQACLLAAQQKVEILLKRSGQPEVEPFEEPGEATPTAGADRE
jgi:exodeoxyribonuclease VII small subunit